jgi:SNF2 family DNA or RNA helicase
VTVDDDDDDLADLLGGLAVDSSKATPVKDEIDTPARPDDSAKIRMLMKLLREIRQRNERTIVFSQFTSFLDLLGPFLDRNAIKFVRCEYCISCFPVWRLMARRRFDEE